MRIKGKYVYVYDIEVFCNCFHCLVKKVGTNNYFYFEISERKNNLNELIDFFSDINKKCICGYNNIHYDNPIINFILDNKNKFLNQHYIQVCQEIFNLSQLIINSESSIAWSKWKYATQFDTLDLLTMLFSEKLRVGLKEMQVTMQFHNVQEYDGDFTKPIHIDEIDNMIKYNKNDVDSTEELLNRCIDLIKLRLDIQKEFNVDVLSKDGMSIGNEILKLKYLEASGKTWKEIKDLRSPCDQIALKDVILPFIKYDTPILQRLLDEMKQQVVSPGRKGYEKHFLLDNLEVSVGVGGIHSRNDPEMIIPKENEVLLDSDVASLYPSLIIEYEFVPKHLGKEWLECYKNIRTDRLYAKKNKLKVKNETYKLALNGASGNFQNQYSWMYDPMAVMKVRINGQLLLLMLTEKIINAGGKIKQLNTDGILYLFPKAKLSLLDSILKEWETLTKLELETDEFECFYQYAINDYVAALKGYSKTKDSKLIKQKGLFIDKVNLGKGMQSLIIPHALTKYFIDKIPIETTIKECKDLNQFITYQKVSKAFQVELNNQLIQRINRYYISTNGYYLYKCRLDENNKRYGYINMLKGKGIKIVNDFNQIKEFPNDIDYRYYIGECQKIINEFERIQLTLF